MESFATALATILEAITSFRLPYAPFFGAVLMLSWFGNRSAARVFTRANAYRQRPSRFLHLFFFLGREYIWLHGPLTGLGIGLLWADPEHAGWQWGGEAIPYFIGAGVSAEVLRVALRAVLKWKRIRLSYSEPPDIGLPDGAPEMPDLTADLVSVPPSSQDNDAEPIPDIPTRPSSPNALKKEAS